MNEVRFVTPMLGLMGIVGFFVWIAVANAPPVNPLAIVGMAMLGTFFGYAAGYGMGLRDHES
jgi:hypothetical protein